MFRSLRNVIFRSDAPPIFEAISLALFVTWIVVFWLWQSFASNLPLAPCQPTDMLIHFRSDTMCATPQQAVHWAREGHAWKALFVSSFLVHFIGVGYRRFRTKRKRSSNSLH